MASISVRKLDEQILNRLREQASIHEISMEEEVRRILKAAVSTPTRIGDLAIQIFGQDHGVNLKLPDRPVHNPMDLSK